MQYIVSARKYRPDSFGGLIGQDNIARTLRNSIKRGQLAHAYLFCGPRGVGKTSTARIFAKTINCMNPTPDMEPCGHCESCVSFDEGRSYCIHELDAASNNGVEDIKQLMEKVRIPPQVGRYSVYIIDEVHMLSQAAFNAFLKTLEEPPAHAIFILATTEKHKILPTILSRCQTYDFNRISIEDIVRNLKDISEKEGVSIGDEALHVIAAKADGAMRDALTLFDQTVAFCGREVSYQDVISNLNVLDYDYYFRLVDCFAASDYASALLLFDEVLSKGFNALYFVSGLSRHFRDLIVSKSGSASSLIELPGSLKERYASQASGLSMKFLYSALEDSVRCESAYRSSVNQRLLIEFTLMKMCRLVSVPEADPVRTVPPVSKPQPAVPSAPPSLDMERLRKVWDDVTEKYKSVPSIQRFYSFMKSAELGHEGDAVVHFFVKNDKQKAWVEANVAEEIEKGLREGLGCPGLVLSVKVAQETSAPVRVAAPVRAVAAENVAQNVKKKSGLSISSVLQEDEVRTAESDAPGDVSGNRASEDILANVKQEDVRRVWDSMTARYESNKMLFAAVSSGDVSLEKQEGRLIVHFSAANEAQKELIQTKLLSDLEDGLRTGLDIVAVSLAIEVAPDSEKSSPACYMPSEKAKYMMENSEEVRNLCEDLGLDLK